MRPQDGSVDQAIISSHSLEAHHLQSVACQPNHCALQVSRIYLNNDSIRQVIEHKSKYKYLDSTILANLVDVAAKRDEGRLLNELLGFGYKENICWLVSLLV